MISTTKSHEHDEDDEKWPNRRGRRRSDDTFNWAAVGVIIALSVNFAALVWGAATMNAGLTGLNEAVVELRLVGKNLQEAISSVTNRLGVLEVRVQTLKEQLDKEVK